MKVQLPKRDAVNKAHTWDIFTIFKDEKTYETALAEIKEATSIFVENHKGKIKDSASVNQAITDMASLQEKLVLVSAYASLHSSGDSTDQLNQLRSGALSILMQDIHEKTAFLITELYELSDDILEKAAQDNKENRLYIKEVIKDKKHMLSPEVNKALITLSPTLNAAYGVYQRLKIVDMKFPDFSVDGKQYPNSFTLFENEWEYESNTLVRRKAYESFYEKLGEYQHGLAANYIAHLQKEKALASLKGFNSTIEALLWNQDVTRDMMDRQIDIIMEKLAPVMRKYAKLLQKIHGLDQMTYADLKIAIDPAFEPKISIEDSKKYLLDGLSILGADYLKIVKRSFDERWIDFPQNIGKSTGGFCSSPYGANSFILINWNGQMDEVMVLAHELGHAGHFQYANANQNILNTRPSLYFIEAPSTTNELIMSRHLAKEAQDLRLRRWVLSGMISRTYYHNFVTHLLEAAFQREVYTQLDQNKPLSAYSLNQIKLDVIRKFWGDDVVIPEYAGLTWMRQPHYFMGLYPYTYSAGLTIGTVVSKEIFEGKLKASDWIEVLKKGGTLSPLDLAKEVGVDLSTSKPLEETIEFIAQVVDEIESITDKL